MWAELLKGNSDAAILQLDQSGCIQYSMPPNYPLKLDLLGLNRNSLSWFTSYMSDHRQTVLVKAAKSEQMLTRDRSCMIHLIYIHLPTIFHSQQHTQLQDVKCKQSISITLLIISLPLLQQQKNSTHHQTPH